MLWASSLNWFYNATGVRIPRHYKISSGGSWHHSGTWVVFLLSISLKHPMQRKRLVSSKCDYIYTHSPASMWENCGNLYLWHQDEESFRLPVLSVRKLLFVFRRIVCLSVNVPCFTILFYFSSIPKTLWMCDLHTVQAVPIIKWKKPKTLLQGLSSEVSSRWTQTGYKPNAAALY